MSGPVDLSSTKNIDLFRRKINEGFANSQPLDATLTAIAALSPGADQYIYFTGTDTATTGTITTFGRSLVDDTTAANARTTLGLGTIATQAANNVSITGGSITGITDLAVADGGTGASTAAAARTNLGIEYAAFRGHRNGTALTGLTANAYNVVPMTTVEFDTRSWYNTSNGRYTPLVAGKYLVSLQVSAGTSGGQTGRASIFKNATVEFQGNYLDSTTTSTYSSPATGILDMNGSTDYIVGQVFLPTGVTAVSGAKILTFMSITYVGP